MRQAECQAARIVLHPPPGEALLVQGARSVELAAADGQPAKVVKGDGDATRVAQLAVDGRPLLTHRFRRSAVAGAYEQPAETVQASR